MVRNLHRADRHTADWEKKAPEDRNVFERVAANTKGILTPGNIVSAAGTILTLSGISDVAKGKKAAGATKIIAGRTLDLVDGWLADKTGTKSATGEAVDASGDKIQIGYALFKLWKADVIDTPVAVSFGVQNAVNTFATVMAKKHGAELHPSGAGKYVTAGQWVSLSGYVLDSMTPAEQTGGDSTLRSIADTVAVGSMVAGAYVNVDYVRSVITGMEENAAISSRLVLV